MKKNLLLRLALTVVVTMSSMLGFATQYCQQELTNGNNTVYLTCQTTGENQYQILIQGTGLQGMGGAFAEVNGVGGYYLNNDHCVVSPDGTSITIDITSNKAPRIYTPLYVMMPGEVNFGSVSDATWEACPAPVVDSIAPVLNSCALVGSPTYNSVTIAVSATDETTDPVTHFVVNDVANNISNKVCTAANGQIVVNGLMVNTSYNLTIQAKDDAGNISANDTTLTFQTANRSSECTGVRGHFGNPTQTKIKFTLSYQGNGIYYQVEPINATDTLVYCEIQTSAGNFTPMIVNNAAIYAQPNVSEGSIVAIRFMYRLSSMGGNEMTAENVSTDDANIVFYVAGECNDGSVIPAQPATAATTPKTYAPGKAIAIFCDTNNQLPNINYNPNWGQSTQVSFDSIDGNNTMIYSSFNYQGTDLNGDVNAANMDSLHIDVWSASTARPSLFPICHTQANGEKSYPLDLIAGQWNSFDIPVSYFTDLGLDMSGIFQFKFANGQQETLYIDNLYFYSNSTDVDTIAPSNVTASVGTITYNSIELKLNATEASEAITYNISYNGQTVTTTGLSEIEKSYVITHLDESTNYNFKIVASDGTGNLSDTVSVSATTAAGLARPTTAAPVPTADSENVISIYSNAYTTACDWIIGGWGQSTIDSRMSIADDEILKLDNFNYLGIELNGNVAAFDASAMTHLHIDVWTPNATSFQISPIWGSESMYNCTPLTVETWNSYDIDLSNFTNINLANIYQFKLIGNGIVYLDNLYLYKQVETSVNETAISAKIYTKENALYLEQLDNAPVMIYTVQGQLIYSNINTANALRIELNQGAYIVKVGNKSVKIIL